MYIDWFSGVDETFIQYYLRLLAMLYKNEYDASIDEDVYCE